MPLPDDPHDLPRQLLRPAAYPGGPGQVEHLQTHISHLFFAGDRVYKVKKPVDLGFLDYTTLAAREHFCQEEVRLNRRLAADVYLGVVPIRNEDTDGGLDIRVGPGEGEIVDYAVEMRRLPAERMLDHLLDRGDADNERMRGLAGLLAEYHAAAATGPGVDEFGAPSAIRANCVENFEQTRPFVGASEALSPRLHRFLEQRTLAFIDDHEALFAARMRDHRIRDGHGDLHAGNICVLEDQIVVYDCIEFAARFRCGDVMADLAFLLMDMDRRCFRAFGEYLLHEYVAHSGDAAGVELVRFYKGYRAFVRGKVGCFGLADLDGEPRREALDLARSYFHLAASYELPPALILACGLPGSGKSFAAEQVGRPFEAVVLNSDRTRKQLAGVAATTHGEHAIDSGLYSADQSARCYAVLLDNARRHLGEGRTVIVDAGFRAAAQRQPFRALADELAVPLVLIHVDTEPQVALARLAARQDRGDSVSDAGVEVYEAVRGRFEAPVEFGTQVVTFDGVSSTSELTAAVLDRLIES